MDITTEVRGSICIMRLHGRFTAEATEQFGAHRAAAREGQPSAMLIDLFEVPYMDSTALGYLLGFYTSCTRAGVRVGIVNVNERLLDMLKLCQLDQVLPLYDNEDRALAALGRGPGQQHARIGR